jgi:selenocysteine lyase/cysteine desulfurase
MPEYLPDRAEAGTLNVPGIAGLDAGLRYLHSVRIDSVFHREHEAAIQCVHGLRRLGLKVFTGAHQAGTVSFVPPVDCEEVAAMLGKKGIAVRAGLHCAPLAHESAGTLETGTVRISFGHDASPNQTQMLQRALKLCLQGK